MDNFEALALKPYLRFVIGDVVYLKSDAFRKTPMTVMRFITYDDYEDYKVSWTTSQSTVDSEYFADETLTK